MKKTFRISRLPVHAIDRKKTIPNSSARASHQWIRGLPAAGMPSSATPSSPHPGLPPLRRTLLPAPSETPSPPGAVRRRRGLGRRSPGMRRPARARAAERNQLLNTLLAAAGNGREEEDAREAGQRQNQRASDPAEAYGDTDAEGLAAAAALPPVTTFP